MALYRMWIKTDRGWQMACSVESENADAAMKEAKAMLTADQARLETMLCEDPQRPPDDR